MNVTAPCPDTRYPGYTCIGFVDRDYIIIVQLEEKDNINRTKYIWCYNNQFCSEIKALRRVRKIFSAVLYMELLCMPVDLMHRLKQSMVKNNLAMLVVVAFM